ncbi:2OG-Fe(II) oxygenase [Rhodospirillum centenum]|uniref:2OG-Fe(II) oxygenase n=1 Tax=Rhodospirillum centenum (strain ATCC 51521 / SW) TaxID=414684 RepID=B6IV76_RHOCS|nr:2OG-Fe(II) oxygenase [Rhodospirillum centenum]ACJ00200.1 hypothetical protein RC1_2828 [Rhodospirillum centenum SW]
MPHALTMPVSTIVRPSATALHLHHALEASRQQEWPFRHWLLTDTLPEPVATGVTRLPHAPAAVGDTQGRRDTHNASRIFFNPDQQQRHPVAADIAHAFQHPETVALLSSRCRAPLAGSFLRIEYCLDTAGFWLRPHTDIGAKLLTLLIYLNPPEDAQDWGTDIYADPAAAPVARTDASFNRALIFVPGSNTWHGFEPRPVRGVRRTLMVNYVVAEWQSRHELAFPDQPVSNR